MTSEPPQEARRIGRYVIEAELGRGAMGIVYRARDPRIDRVVAVKTFLVPPGTEAELAQQLKLRFIMEARAVGSLDPPQWAMAAPGGYCTARSTRAQMERGTLARPHTIELSS